MQMKYSETGAVVAAMGVLSVLRQRLLMPSKRFNMYQRNMSSHQTMTITPSRWQYHKFKDMLHFYTMLGVIPLGLLVLGVNVFIGPAKLVPIPEGYIPQEHEYQYHPITRFIAHYIHSPYQMDYEKKLHVMFVEDEIRQMRLLETKIKRIIREREDVQGYSYVPIMTKYHKNVREQYENMKNVHGSND